MPDAFTFDEGSGSVKKFATRAAMYDYMAQNGHVVLEGDDADKFAKHCEKRGHKEAMSKLSEAKTWA